MPKRKAKNDGNDNGTKKSKNSRDNTDDDNANGGDRESDDENRTTSKETKKNSKSELAPAQTTDWRHKDIPNRSDESLACKNCRRLLKIYVDDPEQHKAPNVHRICGHFIRAHRGHSNQRGEHWHGATCNCSLNKNAVVPVAEEKSSQGSYEPAISFSPSNLREAKIPAVAGIADEIESESTQGERGEERKKGEDALRPNIDVDGGESDEGSEYSVDLIPNPRPDLPVICTFEYVDRLKDAMTEVTVSFGVLSQIPDADPFELGLDYDYLNYVSASFHEHMDVVKALHECLLEVDPSHIGRRCIVVDDKIKTWKGVRKHLKGVRNRLNEYQESCKGTDKEKMFKMELKNRKNGVLR